MKTMTYLIYTEGQMTMSTINSTKVIKAKDLTLKTNVNVWNILSCNKYKEFIMERAALPFLIRVVKFS